MAFDPVAREQSGAAANLAAQALAIANAAQVATASLAWVEITADTIATDGQRLGVNTAVSPIMITLPAEGGTVALRDEAGTWGIHPVTVAGNGTLIGGSATMALDAPGYQVTFSMVDGAWRYTLAYLNGAPS